MIEFSVSILCFNKAELTRHCLSSVLNHSPKSPDICEVIVTDNGSTDETPAMLDELSRGDHRLRVIRHAQNLGVIGAKNLAFAGAGGRYFASLDNDCSVGARWLEFLREPILGDPLVAQVGRGNTFRSLSAKGVGFKGAKTDYIDGSCFLVVAEVARKMGLCDPAYEFAYCEDSDFSLRLQKAGWKVAVARAPVRHSEHKTASGMNLRRYWEHNHRLLMRRWGGYLKDRRFGHPGEPAVKQGTTPGG